jgi:hypothetical protein
MRGASLIEMVSRSRPMASKRLTKIAGWSLGTRPLLIGVIVAGGYFFLNSADFRSRIESGGLLNYATSGASSRYAFTFGRQSMNGVIYLVGLIVVVMLILSFLGLR